MELIQGIFNLSLSLSFGFTARLLINQLHKLHLETLKLRGDVLSNINDIPGLRSEIALLRIDLIDLKYELKKTNTIHGLERKK